MVEQVNPAQTEPVGVMVVTDRWLDEVSECDSHCGSGRIRSCPPSYEEAGYMTASLLIFTMLNATRKIGEKPWWKAVDLHCGSIYDPLLFLVAL